MQEPFKFCSACGAQNNLSAQFCQRCGAQYSGAPPSPVAPARPKQTSMTGVLLICGIVVFGVFALTGAISLITDAGKTPPKSASPTNSPASTSTSASTPDLPPSELMARAKTLLAQPYDISRYNGAWDLLDRIPLQAAEYKASIPLKRQITRAREREDASRRREEEAATIRERKAYAGRVEESLLSDGLDATVKVSGPENRTIRITYVLINRPLVYKLVNEKNFLGTMEAKGFHKVIFSDGYNWSWWYTYDEKAGRWK